MLTLASGMSSVSRNLSTSTDDLIEGDETITVQISDTDADLLISIQMLSSDDNVTFTITDLTPSK